MEQVEVGLVVGNQELSRLARVAFFVPLAPQLLLGRSPASTPSLSLLLRQLWGHFRLRQLPASLARTLIGRFHLCVCVCVCVWCRDHMLASMAQNLGKKLIGELSI